MRNTVITLVLAAGLAVGCGAKPVDSDAPAPAPAPVQEKPAKPADPEKLFGPIEQRTEHDADGDGTPELVVYGGGKVGLLKLGKEGYTVVASQKVDLTGAVKMKVAKVGETQAVVLEHDKLGSPQFTAVKVRQAGLEPADYYTLVAPKPAVTKGYFVHVNKYLNALWLYKDGKLVKTYRTATGRQTQGPSPTWDDYKTNFFTPEGTFKITNFTQNPPYNALKPGDRSFPGGDPGNPLGTRWMGFPVLDGDNAWVWGIHGTSEPEKMGTWASDGCIRMFTKDAEELFATISEGTPLKVVGK